MNSQKTISKLKPKRISVTVDPESYMQLRSGLLLKRKTISEWIREQVQIFNQKNK